MEHRALSNAVQLVRSNALATYVGLVGSVEGAVVSKPIGFTLVRGPGVFSFCNFAAGFDLAPGDVDAAVDFLVGQATECFEFYVFSISGDEPADFDKRLEERGFQCRQSLVSMASSAPIEAKDVGARVVTEPDDRRAVGDFMARQFFWRMGREARQGIAAATAASPHTIWVVGDGSDPIAAVMLVEQPDAVGLFNLCVATESRGKGLGSDLVRAVQSAASRTGRTVVLQCGEELAGWYSNLDFERVGSIGAFTLAQAPTDDILV
jgi:ribosomal protein S18 acetylase RimI-like enzyme